MKHFVWTALLFAACGGAAGPTVADLEKTKEEARAFRPWADFETSVPEGMGDAKVDGDSHSWTATADGKCKTLTVQKVGDSVGNATLADGDCP